MNWEIKDYSELTKDELYGILKLRFRVFVIEQNCTELDLDDKDQVSKHLFVREGEEIIACLRIIPAGISYEEASIGRFAVSRSHRKNGLGRRGMQTAIDHIFSEMGEPAIRISGQAYLRDFYQSLGFRVTKGPYMEADIPHYQLLLKR